MEASLSLEVKFNMQIDCMFLWEFGKTTILCILTHPAYLCSVQSNDYAL